MSEWIRENVDIDDRYIGYNHESDSKWFDPHPSHKSQVKNFMNK